MLNATSKWYKFRGDLHLVCSHLEITNGAITDAVAQQPIVMKMFEKEFVETVSNGEMWEEITHAQFLEAK